MADYGVTYTLTSTAGVLTFNPTPSNTDGLYLSDVGGLDGGNVRSSVEPMPQRDGAIVFSAYREAAYPTLTGFIRASTTTARLTLQDQLRGYTDPLRTSDGTLAWVGQDAVTRQLTVRLLAPVAISNGVGILKTFQLALVAANPLAVSSSLSTTAIASPTATGGSFKFTFSFPFTFGDYAAGSSTITPAGTAPAWPTVTVTGPITNPTITNVTTGLYVSFPGLSVGAGQQLVVDMYNGTAYIGTSNVTGYIDQAHSTFWSLTAGTANVVRVGGTGYTGATSASVAYRNTYI